ncbi:MAG: hypothetical protein ACKN9U_20705, partial [Pirellulaceae bacterium]
MITFSLTTKHNNPKQSTAIETDKHNSLGLPASLSSRLNRSSPCRSARVSKRRTGYRYYSQLKKLL